MTNITVSIFAEELRNLNEAKKTDIKVGRGIDVIVYTGGDPRELIPPYPFSWDEEQNGFSDLQMLKELDMAPIYQLFNVRTSDI